METLKTYNLRNENCTACKYHVAAKTTCVMDKAHKADIMVVTLKPSKREDEKGKRGDQVSELLQNTFNSLDYQGEVYYTSLIKCAPMSEKTLDPTACIREYFLEEVSRVQPKTILFMGETAMRLYLANPNVRQTKEVLKAGDIGKVTLPNSGKEINITFLKDVWPIFFSQDAQVKKTLTEAFLLGVYKVLGTVMNHGDVAAMNTFKILRTVQEVKEYCGMVKSLGKVAMDFETTGLDTKAKGFKITVCGLSFQHGSAIIIPLWHKETPFTGDQLEEVWDLLEGIFEDSNIVKIGHNLKFEMNCALAYGTQIKGYHIDTMVQQHLLDENGSKRLKEIVARLMPKFAGYDLPVSNYTWADCPLEVLAEYCGLDADLTFRVATQFARKLSRAPELQRIYDMIEMPLIRVLSKAQDKGALIDHVALERNIKETEQLALSYEQRLRGRKKVAQYELSVRRELTREYRIKLRKKLREMEDAGKTHHKAYLEKSFELKRYRQNGGALLDYELNFGSPAQLVKLLYSEDGYNFDLPYSAKSRDYAATTARDALITLPDKSGFIDGLLEFRSIEKIQSTYLTGLQQRIKFDKDKLARIHADFMQIGTVTGRLSSSNPNMQNMPQFKKVRNPELRKVSRLVKEAFIAPEGYYIVQADFSQIELRIIAEIAQVKAMIETYAKGLDIHIKTAAEIICNMSVDQFMKKPQLEIEEYRTKAKSINFGFMYEMSAKKFCEIALKDYGVKFTLREAERIKAKYFAVYPELETYYKKCRLQAKRQGYVTTMLGRRRHLPDILMGTTEEKRRHAERQSVNSPVQGTAADLCKLSMVLLDGLLAPSSLQWSQVHDSIMFYIRKDLLDSECALIKATMENLPLKQLFGVEFKYVPIIADIEVSDKNWAELTKYKIAA